MLETVDLPVAMEPVRPRRSIVSEMCEVSGFDDSVCCELLKVRYARKLQPSTFTIRGVESAEKGGALSHAESNLTLKPPEGRAEAGSVKFAEAPVQYCKYL